MTEWWQWAILIVANIPVFIAIGWPIFGDWEEFVECLRFWFTPDFWSCLTGRCMEDMWAELRLAVFFGVCALAVWGEYAVMARMFGW